MAENECTPAAPEATEVNTSPKGDVHPSFQTEVEHDVESSQKAADGIKQDGQRTWFLKKGTPDDDWDGDPLDIPNISKAYPRDDVSENYREVHRDTGSPGTVGDAAGLTLQNDFIATGERAFRSRHATSIRSKLHAAARHAGHANGSGVFLSGVLGYVQDLIKIGKTR